MGLFDGTDQPGGSLFNIGDPNSMMLLGALQGLGAAGAASRMPITPAAVWGGLGGGMLAGQKAASEQIMQQQQISSEAAKNALLMDQITKQAAALGQPVPTMKDIRTGKWQGFDWNNIFGQGGGLFSPAQQAQPTPPQPTGTAGMGPLGNAGLTAPYTAPPPGVGGKVSDITQKVAAISQSKGFDPQFGIEHLGGESDLNPNAVGPALTDSGKPQERPKGIAQLTSDQMHGGDPMNVDQSLAVYGDIMSKLLAKTNGDYVKAAQLYGSIPKDLSTMNRGEQRIYMAAAAANERVKSGQTPPFQLAQNAPDGAAGTGGGVPQTAQQQMPQPGQPSPPISGLMTPQQALIYQARLQALGGKPSEVSQAWLDASFTPPGPLQNLLIASAQNKAGIKLTLGGEKPGSPLLQVVPGGTNYNVAMPPGYSEAVNTLTRAGPAGLAPQKIVSPETGAQYEGPRGQVFAPGNPPVQTELSPGQIETQKKQAEAQVEFGQPPQKLPPPEMRVPPPAPGPALPPPVAAPPVGPTAVPPVAPPPVAPPVGSPAALPMPPPPPAVPPMAPTAAPPLTPPAAAPGVIPTPPPPVPPSINAGMVPGLTAPGVPPAAPPQAAPAVPPTIPAPGAENKNPPVPISVALTNQTARAYSPVIDPKTGTIIPPASTQPEYTIAALRARQEKWAAREDQWTNDANLAQQAEQRLWTIRNALQSVRAGANQTERAAIAAQARVLGLGDLADKILGTDPKAVEIAVHENLKQTIASLKSQVGSRGPTQREVFNVADVSESPNLQPEADHQMLAEDITIMQRAQNLPTAWNTAKTILGAQDPTVFEHEWGITYNPLAPQVEAMKNYIGPLAGMKGAPLPSNQAVIPPAPVTATGPNGHQLRLSPDGTAWIDTVTGQPFMARSPLPGNQATTPAR